MGPSFAGLSSRKLPSVEVLRSTSASGARLRRVAASSLPAAKHIEHFHQSKADRTVLCIPSRPRASSKWQETVRCGTAGLHSPKDALARMSLPDALLQILAPHEKKNGLTPRTCNGVEAFGADEAGRGCLRLRPDSQWRQLYPARDPRLAHRGIIWTPPLHARLYACSRWTRPLPVYLAVRLCTRGRGWAARW